MSDNLIQLRYSDDGGRNWSQWRNKDLGAEGERLTPCVLRQMGRTQHRIYQFRDTSPYRHDLIDVGVSVAI